MKEVVVIGSGLAGLYAAYTASMHGAEVKVYEKNISIGKTLKCGEMFTSIYGMPPSECILSEINEWKFDFSLVSKELEPIVVHLPDKTMFMTDRSVHEHIMYERCIENGVKFIFGNKHIPFDRNFGNITINATGHRGFPVGEQRHSARAYSYIVQSDGFDVNIALFKLLPDMSGYYWAFPRGSNTINTGCGYYGNTDSLGIGSKKNFINANSVKYNIKDMCPPESNIYDTIIHGGGLIPINYNFELPYYYVRNGEMYVGDAAGLVNPALCGGEHLAVLSGRLAGYTSAVNNDVLFALNRYTTGIIDIIKTEMSVGVLLSKMQGYLNPIEFYDAFKSISGCADFGVNSVSISYIKRKMAEYITAPDTTEKELEELI